MTAETLFKPGALRTAASAGEFAASGDNEFAERAAIAARSEACEEKEIYLRAERQADARIVAAAGCLCRVMQDLPSFNGELAGSKARPRVIRHDWRCPKALAAAILARDKEGA